MGGSESGGGRAWLRSTWRWVLRDQRPCCRQIGGVEPLAEPAVDVGERLSGFLHLSLALPQRAQADRCSELPRLGGLPSGRVDRRPEARFGPRRPTCPDSPTLT